ncbi:hypothetical protein GCM10010492_63260 [Saccharothrix mutabilis subsp. mutabilis]|uniref:Uncharacterized protein n=1 Tax=Saccharothrix mutabilis subsp. mutabilis TaxID=66855 RepID=A0ABP3E947_9PSEU
MKTHDLSQVFHDHADPPGDTPHAARMAAVRARVRGVRRRRAFVAAACVVLALVGGALAATPNRTDSQPAAPEPFPEHIVGSRVVAQTTGRTPEPLTLAFTPSGDPADVRLFVRCDIDAKDVLKVSLAVDGKEVRLFGCDKEPGGFGSLALSESLVAGRRAVVRLTVLGRVTGPPNTAAEVADVEPAADGIPVALAVGRRVPITEYPMPPAPEKPVEVDHLVHPADVVLRSDPADPNLPQKVVVPWRTVTRLHVVWGSPGRIKVLIGGVLVDDGASYSYGATGRIDASGHNPPDLVPGQPVEISVVPEGQRGEWAVMVDMGG